MAEKPGFNVASGFNGGITVGINADSWPEFVTLCRQVWGDSGADIAYGLYQNLRNQALPVGVSEQQALGLLQSQLGAVPVDTRNGQAGVGYQQPLVQPAYQQAPPAQTQNGPPPGQTCDPKDPRKTKWVPAGVSSKTGKAYVGFWALP